MKDPSIHPGYTVTVCDVVKSSASVVETYDRLGRSTKMHGAGPKLYMVTTEKKIVYVGVAKQPLASRLRYGFSATGRSGYYGYHWAKEDGRYAVHCWRFPDDTKMEDLETIEAEAVFVLRRSYGQWPKHQTEIHFHQSETWHRQKAAQLVKVLRISLSDSSTLYNPWKAPR